MSLPYEDLQFAKGEVLTAEKLNKLTKNIQYIANFFPIQSSSIDSHAITADKLPLSQMYSIYSLGSKTASNSSSGWDTTELDSRSFMVGPGYWVIIAVCDDLSSSGFSGKGQAILSAHSSVAASATKASAPLTGDEISRSATWMIDGIAASETGYITVERSCSWPKGAYGIWGQTSLLFIRII